MHGVGDRTSHVDNFDYPSYFNKELELKMKNHTSQNWPTLLVTLKKMYLNFYNILSLKKISTKKTSKKPNSMIIYVYCRLTGAFC